MKTMVICRIGLAALASVGAVATGFGQTAYTFQPQGGANSGDWNDSANWDPTPSGGNLPGSHPDDTVTIPVNKTCRIQNASQSIKSMTVAGELHIIDRTLTLGKNSTATTTNVSGKIIFQDNDSTATVAGTPTKMLVRGTATIAGLELKTQSATSGPLAAQEGRFEIAAANGTADLLSISGYLGSTSVVQGGFFFNVNMESTSAVTFKNTNAVQSMIFGPASGSTTYTFRGTGAFELNGGEKVVFRKYSLNAAAGFSNAYSGTMTVNGGGVLEFRAGCVADSTRLRLNVFKGGLAHTFVNLRGRKVLLSATGDPQGGSPQAEVRTEGGGIAIFEN